MTFEELKDKALSLPYEPGVYLMQDKTGTVIYVGKAKKLKNRVSQYFQDTASHTPKTRKMVSQIDHFDTIVARSEFEALVLECSLIKRHMPKYNILLKDDKGYPYLRVDLAEDYPTMQMVSRITGDKASYFGPFGGRFVTQHVIDTLRQAVPARPRQGASLPELPHEQLRRLVPALAQPEGLPRPDGAGRPHPAGELQAGGGRAARADGGCGGQAAV